MPGPRVRPAAVAGMFYPGVPRRLRRDVEGYLAQAAEPARGDFVKAIIAPHAGYTYSGAIAGSAFRAIGEGASRINRVVLLGPAHRVALRGLALADADFFRTPLGLVELDADAATAIAHCAQVSVNERAHAEEHALEVEIPFLQVILERFSLCALVVGEASAAEVSEVLECVWGEEETLIVVSSDLSHYLPYEEACARDRRTAERIQDLDHSLSPHDACGARPINGLLATASAHELVADLVDLRNSGDTAGSRDQVVGYGAFAFRAAG